MAPKETFSAKHPSQPVRVCSPLGNLEKDFAKKLRKGYDELNGCSVSSSKSYYDCKDFLENKSKLNQYLSHGDSANEACLTQGGTFEVEGPVYLEGEDKSLKIEGIPLQTPKVTNTW
eukprot:CAMPEP_0195527504 /NCGR_PEP_ID=MMETSP0794_2-20130614/29221_1 /TAXON_ID=515487 /ORGANISM="Stephanopyxis turris, Strain CCMP 815" /LENGTH=116 /DNA_ID=CAMNT_0040658423 /DNA_START=111 /DNA_END=458 /DNA_ORIENTATION=-